MSNDKSIIHPKFEGSLVLISGLHGLGKTTLAATMENPAKTGLIDFDLKGRALANELGIVWYASPENTGNPDDYDVKTLSNWFLANIAKVPDGITHLIIDNATWAEAGLEWRVLQNPAKYGVNAKNAQAGVYGGAKPGVTVLWANIFTFLQSKGVKVVTAINHMSQPWADGKPVPNKFNIKGNKVFQQIASLAIILTPADISRGGKPPVPSGLVVKEALSINRYNAELGEFSTVKVIPARLPVCNWKRISGYFDKPADFGKPANGEIWTQQEVYSYSEWLSPEQVQWVMKVGSYSDEAIDATDQATKAPVTVEQPRPMQPVSQPTEAKATPQQVHSATPTDIPNSPKLVMDAIKNQLGVDYYQGNASHLHNAVGASFPKANDLSGWADYLAAAIAHAELRITEKAEPENEIPLIKTNG
jgi:hypothetical protein